VPREPDVIYVRGRGKCRSSHVGAGTAADPPSYHFVSTGMTTRGMRRMTAVLLACAGMAACGGERDAAKLDDQVADAVPRRLTRQEARAEYLKCIRTMTTTESSAADGRRDHINANPSTVCDHLRAQAYPEPRHVRRREAGDVGHGLPQTGAR